MRVGLRVDVDTFRGTKWGVPNLCRLLGRHGIRASFFFSVGPDNMGRHVWRLLRPAFFAKMVRSKAASLYGWEILLRGTLWPGPEIGRRLAGPIRTVAKQGHEIGLHAWDHHRWQVGLETMPRAQVRRAIQRGVESLTQICGRVPASFASPGWRCLNPALEVIASEGFSYSSDCRGESVFLPGVGGEVPAIPQVPVTLPTYDELIGRGGIDDENYNLHSLSLLRPEGLNVLTVHAEVEGMACQDLFAEYLSLAAARGITFHPLGELVPGGDLPVDRIEKRSIPGREGWMAWQASADGGGAAA